MRAVLALLALCAVGCETRGSIGSGEVVVRPLFAPAPSQGIPGCVHGSLVSDDLRGLVLAAAADGHVYALDRASGVTVYDVALPAPSGERPFVSATPVVVGRSLVVAYHTIAAGDALPDVTDPRLRHRLAVVDLDAGALDPSFPPFDLSASATSFDGETVLFNAPTQIARAALVHMHGPGTLGRVVLSFGNVRDLQPWHGWVIGVDLDVWRAGQSPIAGSFVVTPETACGADGSSGSNEDICGGGIWSTAGPLVVPDAAGDDELVVATGNGQFDLSRGDYANTLVRLDGALGFQPACDSTLCATETTALSDACAKSCARMTYPRLLGEAPPRPESGVCDMLSVQECVTKLDWDFGSGTPAQVTVGDHSLLVQGTKDGSVYLVDADHLGTIYDRVTIAEPCGTTSDKCQASWAGMIVAQPTIVEGSDHVPLALVPTFEFDHSHPAGLHALAIVDGPDGPRFSERWRAPADDTVATQRFRAHTSNVALATLGGASSAWIVDPSIGSDTGRLLGVAVDDGRVLADLALVGRGMRFTRPLVVGDALYVASCVTDRGPSRIEGYALVAR